jgi:hypothetical protein
MKHRQQNDERQKELDTTLGKIYLFNNKKFSEKSRKELG